jgi:hypothetical protein
MTAPAEFIDLADGGVLGVEVMADDQDHLRLVLWRYGRAEGGFQALPGPGLILALEDAEKVFYAMLRVTELAERAAATGALRLGAR